MDALPDSVIVLLVILAAAFSVCMGYGVNRLFFKAEAISWNQKSQPQMEYMREVRERARMQVWAEARTGKRHYPEGYRVSEG
jgi:hypothetical protein